MLVAGLLAHTKCLLVLLRAVVAFPLGLPCHRTLRALVLLCRSLYWLDFPFQDHLRACRMDMRFLARGQPWSEVQDSSSDSADDAAAPTAPPPATRVSRFPLRTVLHAYLRGVLFREGHSSSLLTLQRLLLHELPADTLPRGLLRDLVYSFSFDVDTVLLHVNNFLRAAASRAVVGAVLWQWLIFVWLECLRLPDPPRPVLLGCLWGVALVADF